MRNVESVSAIDLLTPIGKALRVSSEQLAAADSTQVLGFGCQVIVGVSLFYTPLRPV